ncbi:MAG: hypothetical protein HY293_07135 [Planctomycetes bacterium]|nr:hypothetical protein [Planctomycetota bacterium]
MSKIKRLLIATACLLLCFGLWYLLIGKGLPHSTWTREYRAKDPLRDAAAAWDAGDRRFKGVYGDGLSAPGLPYDEFYFGRRYGVDGIRGTSDCFATREQAEFQSVACEYARKYNGVILQRVQGSPSTKALRVRDLIQKQGGKFAIVDGEIAAVTLTLRSLRDAATLQALKELGDIDFLRVSADIHSHDSDLDLLTGLTGLTHLDLSDSQISDAGLDRVARLFRLSVLMLSRTRVGDAGLAKLKALGRLQALYLHDTRVTDAGMESVAALHSLESLYLLQTGVTDAGLVWVGQLENLRDLHLSEAATDAGLAGLTRLTKLRFLGTRFTKVTPAGIAALKKSLPQLVLPD